MKQVISKIKFWTSNFFSKLDVSFELKSLRQELNCVAEKQKMGIGSWHELNVLWELEHGTIENAKKELRLFELEVLEWRKKSLVTAQ